jgi:hypothetical protein
MHLVTNHTKTCICVYLLTKQINLNIYLAKNHILLGYKADWHVHLHVCGYEPQ